MSLEHSICKRAEWDELEVIVAGIFHTGFYQREAGTRALGFGIHFRVVDDKLVDTRPRIKHAAKFQFTFFGEEVSFCSCVVLFDRHDC